MNLGLVITAALAALVGLLIYDNKSRGDIISPTAYPDARLENMPMAMSKIEKAHAALKKAHELMYEALAEETNQSTKEVLMNIAEDLDRMKRHLWTRFSRKS